MTLKEFFAQTPKAALAFSGGTDSAYLLAQGLKLGADLRPYYMKTALQPAFELKDARRLCDQLGVELTVVELDLLGADLLQLRAYDGIGFLPLHDPDFEKTVPGR